MSQIDYYKRRCGNTTRQVDEWIQDLFNGKEVKVIDHAHREGNVANRCAMDKLLGRLEFEHGLSVGKNSQLKFVDANKTTLQLLPF